MRKEFLAIKLFVKFGYNYSEPKEFIDYICEKCNKQFLKDHLMAKFDNIYDTFGSHAAMNYFFCELDGDLQEALVEYALEVYAPIGMGSTYDEYKSI